LVLQNDLGYITARLSPDIKWLKIISLYIYYYASQDVRLPLKFLRYASRYVGILSR